MRLIALIALAILATGCATRPCALSVDVVPYDNHPYLADHHRLLRAKVGDRVIDRASLYPDPGGGVPLHFVHHGDHITVVDCNGAWFDVTADRITPIDWQWMKPLPPGPIYRIARNADGTYTTTHIDPIPLDHIYLYKDPDPD